MKKRTDIPARMKKLEEELRELRATLDEDREITLQKLPDPLEVLIGQVGEQFVAIPLLSVREVLPRVFLEGIPESPDYLAGYLNWRGVPVPVIDPAARWDGKPLPIRLEDRIVIFTAGGNVRALLLSQIEQITSISHSELGKIPSEISAASYSIAMWYAADRNVLLIAPERLVDPAEMARYETA